MEEGSAQSAEVGEDDEEEDDVDDSDCCRWFSAFW